MRILTIVLFLLFSSCSSNPKREDQLDDFTLIYNKLEDAAFFEDKELFTKLSKKIDINYQDQSGKTILHNVCFFKQYDFFLFIIANYPNLKVNIYDDNSKSAFSLCLNNKKDFIRKFLELGANPNDTNQFDYNLIHIAFQKENIDLLNLAIKYNVDPFKKGFMDKNISDYFQNLDKKKMIQIILKYQKNYKPIN